MGPDNLCYYMYYGSCDGVFARFMLKKRGGGNYEREFFTERNTIGGGWSRGIRKSSDLVYL